MQCDAEGHGDETPSILDHRTKMRST